MVPTRYHVSEDQDEEEGESGLAENEPYTSVYQVLSPEISTESA